MTTPTTSRDVRANPGNRAGRYVETAEYIQAARRFVRGAGRRVGDMNIDDLDMLMALAEEANAILHEAARDLHDREKDGYSWQEIGEAVGYDPSHARHTAWKRFKGARKAFPADPRPVVKDDIVGISGRKYAGRAFRVERVSGATALLAPVGGGPKVRAFHDLITDAPEEG
jgi:hypothetical protein